MEMATYRHWFVSLWWDPDDVSHSRILSPDKTEWRLISAIHSADEDYVSWLTTYGSWHAYEKKNKKPKQFFNNLETQHVCRRQHCKTRTLKKSEEYTLYTRVHNLLVQKLKHFWFDQMGHTLALRGPHIARGPYAVHPCYTLGIQSWMAAYPGCALQMNTLFPGWPIMVHDMHTRRRISRQVGVVNKLVTRHFIPL